ncbi:MAG: hypothetical protein U0K59_01225 [Bacteroidales bacterium]|nr:hypothetical protein [Bacteroidales bacterium]
MKIYDFIKELERSEIGDKSHNGVSLLQGIETYSKILKDMFFEAKAEIINLTDKQIRLILQDVKTLIEETYYDVPTEEVVKRMEEDYLDSRNSDLKKEIEFVKFLRSMVGVQKYYSKELYNMLSEIIGVEKIEKSQKEEVKTEENQKETKEGKVIKGVQGLADYLKIGKTLAQAVINSNLLEQNKAQYRVGKTWNFDKNKIDELLEKYPEILKDVHIKRREK